MRWKLFNIAVVIAALLGATYYSYHGNPFDFRLKQLREEKNFLLALDCQPTHFYLQDERLVLGDDSNRANTRQIFLIKNISDKPLTIDFPEGHIGATAWITQYLKPNQWIGYLYFKGKDTLPVEEEHFQGRMRTVWVCKNDDGSSGCQSKIYACEIHLNRQLKQVIPMWFQSLQKLLTSDQAQKSWWSGDAKDRIDDVIRDWRMS